MAVGRPASSTASTPTSMPGALDYSRHLHTPFTLTEARVLYELAHSRRTDAADLRAALLDAGHLSLDAGRVRAEAVAGDARAVGEGRAAAADRADRARAEAASLLEEALGGGRGSPLLCRPDSADRPARLTAAMRTVQDILRDGQQGDCADRVPPCAGRARADLGWVVEAQCGRLRRGVRVERRSTRRWSHGSSRDFRRHAHGGA